VHIGTGLLADLKCREFSGMHKTFTRLAQADFEILINFVGPKIFKGVTYFEQLFQCKRDWQ
jgi:hypothetical protein